MAMSNSMRRSTATAALLAFSFIFFVSSTGDASRFTEVLAKRPICTACLCCEPPPPGSCCRCCASSSPSSSFHVDQTNGGGSP